MFLFSGKTVGLTTDGWTSRAGDGYTVFTCHCIVDWEQRSYVLSTVQTTDHTSSGIKDLLLQVCIM